ncbi:uncharacterized protein LOC121803912 isoform X1 [Salvia splendens]|uniref:uncharacterized protein LOC121803912 isoform X1 n=1 Tax=Salvia splendens TaxID=180675 RepID=UPI001C280CED|nr:uncharacterized protein LOC121803912 isoform X1 [Salvia splendens]
METIEFEVKYVDNGEKEIELVLDLGKFKRYAPHCHNCNHLATKLILRRKILDPNQNQNQTKKYWFVIWFEFFVVLIWGKPDLTPPNQVHQPAGSGKNVNKEGLLPTINLQNKNGNEPKRADTGKIENEEGGKDQLPSIDQPDENEHEPKGDIGKDENDGKHKEEGGKDKHPSTDKPDKNENGELRKKKKKEKKQKTGSESESSDSEADTDEEEMKLKILDLLER